MRVFASSLMDLSTLIIQTLGQAWEDILNVIDGRPSIVDEMTAATDALQKYVGEQFTSLLSRSDIGKHFSKSVFPAMA